MVEDKKKLQFEVILETADSASSIRDIKNSLKELKNAASEFGEGSKEFDRVTQKAGELKDKLDDVNEAINAKKGEGFERFGNQLRGVGDSLLKLDFSKANTQINTMRDGFKNIGFKDVMEGAKGFGSVLINLGKTILANPIFLLATVVVGIGVALFELKDKVKIVGQAFDAITGVFNKIIQGVKDFTDAIGLTNFALEAQTKKVEAEAKKQGDIIQTRYDREIAMASATGQGTLDLEIDKRRALIETSKVHLEQINIRSQANGKLTDVEKKQIEDNKKLIEQAQSEISVLRAQDLEARKRAAKELQIQEIQSEINILKAKGGSIREIAALETKIVDLKLEGIRSVIKQEQDESEINFQMFRKKKESSLELLVALKEEKKLIEEKSIIAINLGNQELDIQKKKLEEWRRHKEEVSKGLEEIKPRPLEVPTPDLQPMTVAVDEAASDINTSLGKITGWERLTAFLQENISKINEWASVGTSVLNGFAELSNVTSQNTIMNLQAETQAQQEKYDLDLAMLNQRQSDEQANLDFQIEQARQKGENTDALEQRKIDAQNASAQAEYQIQKASLTNQAKAKNAEVELKREAFEKDKKFKMAQAIASTALAIANALTTVPFIPAGLTAAVTAGVSGGFQIAAIQKTQFDSSGGVSPNALAAQLASIPKPQTISSSGGGGSSSGGSRLPSSPNGVRPNDFSLFGTAGAFNNLMSGSNQRTGQGSEAMRAYVVESDVTEVQKRIQKFKSGSEL